MTFWESLPFDTTGMIILTAVIRDFDFNCKLALVSETDISRGFSTDLARVTLPVVDTDVLPELWSASSQSRS